MNFLEDSSWQDDPSVIVSDITTTGTYALAVNGGFNATSLSINGTDITSIFTKALTDGYSNIKTDYLIVNSNITTSNILINNSLTQIGIEDINFRGNLITSGNISIGSTDDYDKMLFIGGSIISASNITSNLNSINIVATIAP